MTFRDTWVRYTALLSSRATSGSQLATGAGERIIKSWNLASGELRLSLTGHISTVRGLAVSPRHPYLFSCGEDKVRTFFKSTLKAIQPLTRPALDGKMLGSRGQQSHPTLPWSSFWRLLPQSSSDSRCACHVGP